MKVRFFALIYYTFYLNNDSVLNFAPPLHVHRASLENDQSLQNHGLLFLHEKMKETPNTSDGVSFLCAGEVPLKGMILV